LWRELVDLLPVNTDLQSTCTVTVSSKLVGDKNQKLQNLKINLISHRTH